MPAAAVLNRPVSAVASPPSMTSFLVHQHRIGATLCYVLCVQTADGLLTWVLPKAPSCDPSESRIALLVDRNSDMAEDLAALGYLKPSAEHASDCTTRLWDTGTWRSQSNPAYGANDGQLALHLDGEKLHGLWLMRRVFRGSSRFQHWTLTKGLDEWARPIADFDLAADVPAELLNNASRTLSEFPRV